MIGVSLVTHTGAFSTVSDFMLMRWLRPGPLDSFSVGTELQKKPTAVIRGFLVIFVCLYSLISHYKEHAIPLKPTLV